MHHRVVHILIQIDVDAPLDTFWTRAGFQFVYERYGKQEPVRLLGDNRRFGGELAFRLHETAPLVVRTRTPLKVPKMPKDMHWIHEGVMQGFAEGVIGRLTPESYRMTADTEPMDVRCGYDAQNELMTGVAQRPFVHTVFTNATESMRRVREEWQLDDVDAAVGKDTLYSQALLAAFAACMVQAHAHGFTLYDDLPHPLTASAVATDGGQWLFATYQLNTMRHLAYDFHEQRVIDHLLGDTDEDPEVASADSIAARVLRSPANVCWYSGGRRLQMRNCLADVHKLYVDVRQETHRSSERRFINGDVSCVRQLVSHLLAQPMTTAEMDAQWPVADRRPYMVARTPTMAAESEFADVRRLTESERARKKEIDDVHPVVWTRKIRKKY